MTIIDNNDKLFEGFLTVCDAVSATLGAEGKLAVLENLTGVSEVPFVTKDGVTVARHITESDPIKRQGVFIAKSAAVQTLAEVGDNTTTTMVLAKAILEETKESEGKYRINKKIEKGFDIAQEEVEKLLKKYSRKADKKTVKSIATVAANNDEKLGAIIAEAYDQSNNGSGILTAVKNKHQRDTTLIVKTGYNFNSGYYNPAFINNEKRASYEAEDVNIILYQGYEIHKSGEVINFISKTKGQPVLVVVERLGDLVWLHERISPLNKQGFNICFVESSDFLGNREHLLEDLAAYTGGEVFIQGTSKALKAGKAERVSVNLYETSITNARSERIEEKIKDLRDTLADPTIQKEERFLIKRIEQLEGSSVTIVVGGDTEVDLNETYDRVDDAIHAVRSVLEEGWVAGGGSTLTYIAGKMNQDLKNEEMQRGYNIIKKAITAPMYQICENSERSFSNYLKQAQEKYGVGYNGTKDSCSNLIKDNILDSRKGIRIALKNAKATAVSLLNTKVISIYKTE